MTLPAADELRAWRARPPCIVGVEDARDMAEAIRLTLTSEGFDVRLAHDGHIGLELARSAAPDVVLLDIDLPDIDGWEVRRQVRTSPMRTWSWSRCTRTSSIACSGCPRAPTTTSPSRSRPASSWPHPGDAPSPAEARWSARAADVGHRRERRARDVGQGLARFLEQRLGVGERVAVLAVGTTSALYARRSTPSRRSGEPRSRARDGARAGVSRPHGEPLKPMIRSRCME